MDERFLMEIVVVVIAAILGGLGLSALKQPPILGYIMAGIILGPSGLRFIQARDQVENLAQLGVLLLLFVIGIELNLRTFKKIWGVSILCTFLQIIFSLTTTLVLSHFLGWSFELSILLGFIMALSSTAVVVKMLETIGEYTSEVGQTIIGILIGQDLAIIPMILILHSIHPDAAQTETWLKLVTKISIAIGLIVVLISYLSRRQRIRIPFFERITNETDLIPLVSLVLCFGASTLTGLIGLSEAYGAFLAGLVLGNSHERVRVLDTIKPVQSILMMVFCLSIGLLLDIQFVYDNIWTVLTFLFIATIVKTILNIGILMILRLPWQQSFFIGVILGQIGEFAFLLVSVAYRNGIINDFGQKLIVSLTVLSLLTSPLWMSVTRHIKEIVTEHAANWRPMRHLSYGFRYFLTFRRFWRRLWRGHRRHTTLYLPRPNQRVHLPKTDIHSSSDVKK